VMDSIMGHKTINAWWLGGLYGGDEGQENSEPECVVTSEPSEARTGLNMYIQPWHSFFVYIN
jgi:hypothetical protein